MKWNGLKPSTATAVLSTLLLLLPMAAHTERDVENDPYVQLYKVRVEFAKMQKERQAARVEYEQKRAARNRVLLERNAVSQQEYEESVASYQMNRALFNESDVRIKEAEALLTLCRIRIETGKDMPIFPISSNTLDNPFVPSR